MYIECDNFQMKQKGDDIIVMDKVNVIKYAAVARCYSCSLQDTKKLLTGPYAHHVIKKGAEDTVRQKWRVFLWSVDESNLRLKKGKTVLCKVRSYT